MWVAARLEHRPLAEIGAQTLVASAIESFAQIRAGRTAAKCVGAVELRPRRRAEHALERTVERDGVTGDLVSINDDCRAGTERETLIVGRREEPIVECGAFLRIPNVGEIPVEREPVGDSDTAFRIGELRDVCRQVRVGLVRENSRNVVVRVEVRNGEENAGDQFTVRR